MCTRWVYLTIWFESEKDIHLTNENKIYIKYFVGFLIKIQKTTKRQNVIENNHRHHIIIML